MLGQAANRLKDEECFVRTMNHLCSLDKRGISAPESYFLRVPPALLFKIAPAPLVCVWMSNRFNWSGGRTRSKEEDEVVAF